MVPALTATIKEPNNVVIRGVLIKGGTGEEVGITPSDVSGHDEDAKQNEFVVYSFLRDVVLFIVSRKSKSRTFYLVLPARMQLYSAALK